MDPVKCPRCKKRLAPYQKVYQVELGRWKAYCERCAEFFDVDVATHDPEGNPVREDGGGRS
jgi:hypothetical protein